MENNTSSQQTTFWKYLQKHEIEIPIIQRDYAQGRVGKEELRKSFLGYLKKALDGTILKLDFVYGSNQNDKMNPLDGQQRLTTLWLLHWYIALKAGKLTENKETFKHFSYETRVSSREFIERLCEYNNTLEVGKLVSDIQNQTWFYSAWKQDPTIQSMLRMLSGTPNKDKNGTNIIDGIEELFDSDTDFKNYWEQLTEINGKTCPIIFYSLALNELKLTDDLYIKMNARGEQLTSFENFKADLVGYIKSKSDEEDNDEKSKNSEFKWKNLLNPKEGIPIKMDTTWTDIFWKNNANGNIDDIYFAFLNRFFWNELFIAKDNDTYILDIGKGDETSTQENNNPSYKYLNDDEKIAYKNFDVYKYKEIPKELDKEIPKELDKEIPKELDKEIPIKLFSSLQTVLDNYKKFVEFSKNNNSKPIIPECTWDKTFHFIPQYKDENGNNDYIKNTKGEKILKVISLNQVQRIVFFAICKYFLEFNKKIVEEVDYKSFERWMRVVWNLVSGEDSSGRSQIRSTGAMRTAIEFIHKLNSQDVYTSLLEKTFVIGNSTDFDWRCLEEIAKANQILNKENSELRMYNGEIERFKSKSWEDVIIEAEKYAFFKGAIRFLFRDDKGEWHWENFDTKLKNAQMYFDEKGVKKESQVDLTKALVIQCDDWNNQLYDKQIFNPNAITWKWILTANNWIKPIHYILSTNLLNNIPEAQMFNNKKDENDIIRPIIKDLPFKEIIENEPNSRFKWHNNLMGLYKPFGNNPIIFDWKNWKRNEILSSLCEDPTISSNQKIEGFKFFRGWDINFSYNNNGKIFNFQWNRDGNIYLLNKSNVIGNIIKIDKNNFKDELDKLNS